MDDAVESPLNVFEVTDESGATRHFIAFLDPVTAEQHGIPSCAVVGEFRPDAQGLFDPTTFQLNGDFLIALREYMNGSALQDPAIQEHARQATSPFLYVIDPRFTDDDGEPQPRDVLGAFSIDDDGKILEDSFEYNEEHVLFDPEHGLSGIFVDASFSQWLRRGIPETTTVDTAPVVASTPPPVPVSIPAEPPTVSIPTVRIAKRPTEPPKFPRIQY